MNKSAEPYVIASASVMGHIRKTKHLSQQKMAILCGIPLARYKAYENAIMPLTLFHLESICNKTGESIDMFVYYIYTN